MSSKLMVNERVVYRKESVGELKSKLTLFLISPILSLAYSLKRLNSRSSFLIFFLFAALFGYTLYIPAEKGMEALSVDSTYHRMFFEKISVNETFSQFVNRFIRYITFDIDISTGEIIKDFYLETIFFISSIFSSNYHLAFSLFCVIFAFFSLKCLRFLVLTKDFRFSYYTLCIVLIFLFNDIGNIHWLRFPTASWMAVLMIFQIYVNHDKRYWLMLPLIIFVHGSFFVFVLLIIVAHLTRKYETLWISLFVFSFFVSSVPSDVLAFIGNILPERFSVYLSYASDETIEGRADLIAERRTSSFIELFAVIINVYINILMLIIIRNREKIKYEQKNLFSVLLVLFTIVNIFAFFKEFSERYRLIVFPLLAYIWICLFPKVDKRSRIVYLIPFIFSYQFALSAYVHYMTSGYSMFITPLYTIFRIFFIGEV